MKLVPYAEWPESQVMMGCKWAEYTEVPDALICLKKGECTCLKHGSPLPEDRKDNQEED